VFGFPVGNAPLELEHIEDTNSLYFRPAFIEKAHFCCSPLLPSLEIFSKYASRDFRSKASSGVSSVPSVSPGSGLTTQRHRMRRKGLLSASSAYTEAAKSGQAP
jgi:hypothetical protein